MKAMKLRQVLHSGRATVAALAGTVMVIGGAGAGTAALALSHSAGALSLQAPAIAVKEQNVNAAGRIRVALPNGGVGVNGTVSVNNFPKTQPVTGTVNVGNFPAPQNAAGVPHQFNFGPWGTLNPGQSATVLNITGSGTFANLRAQTETVSSNCFVTVTIDGHVAFAQDCNWGQYSPGSGAISGGVNPQGGYVINYNPATPLTYSKSLVVTVTNNSGNTGYYWVTTGYTTAS